MSLEWVILEVWLIFVSIDSIYWSSHLWRSSNMVSFLIMNHRQLKLRYLFSAPRRCSFHSLQSVVICNNAGIWSSEDTPPNIEKHCNDQCAISFLSSSPLSSVQHLPSSPAHWGAFLRLGESQQLCTMFLQKEEDPLQATQKCSRALVPCGKAVPIHPHTHSLIKRVLKYFRFPVFSQ